MDSSAPFTHIVLRIVLMPVSSLASLASPARASSSSQAVRAFAVLVALAGLTACTVPVANGLEEGDANRIVIVLDHANVDSSKEIDPQIEGHYRVTLSRDDVPHALAAMQGEELPRPRPAGVLDSMGKGSLVPSETAEHAQLVAGLAGDLERTLESIDGVLSARVHLNVATPDPLHDSRDAPPPKTTGSVLLEHRGTTPPLTTDAIQRLIAGGVTGLAPADVAVVLVARMAVPAAPDRGLSHVGPIAVARASRPLLQIMLVALAALVAALSASTLYFSTRASRLRRLLAQGSSAASALGQD